VTANPAALVLADHQPVYVTAATQPGSTVRCCCGEWAGLWCEFATHQAEVLVGGAVAALESLYIHDADLNRLHFHPYGTCTLSGPGRGALTITLDPSDLRRIRDWLTNALGEADMEAGAAT
jgi:hypothetical protein